MFTHFCGNPVFSFLFSQLCCPTCSKAENYLKQDQAKNHPSQSFKRWRLFCFRNLCHEASVAPWNTKML